MTQTELNQATSQLLRILEIMEHWMEPNPDDERGPLRMKEGFQSVQIFKDLSVLAVYRFGCVRFGSLEEMIERLREQELHQRSQ